MMVYKITEKKRYWIAVFCFLAYVIAFMDRSNIGVLIIDPAFTNTLGIAGDKTSQGLLMSVFLFCYGVSCFIGGPFVQRFGARKALIVGLFCWALCMMIMGAVSTLLLFLICRGVLGLGESVLGPSVSSLIQAWFPKNERTTANGIWYIGIKVAQIIATPLLAWWIVQFNWRGSFYILAAIGLIPVILAITCIYNKPMDHPHITSKELTYIQKGQDTSKGVDLHQGISFSFLKNINFWYITGIYSIINASVWGFVSWIPSYLKGTLGFSWSEMGALSALPYVLTTISVMILTPLMDKYNRRAVFAMICCAVFVLSLILSMQASSRMVAVLALSFALAFGSPANPAVFTMIQNVIDKEQIASATGFLNGFSYIFTSIAPVGMGALYTMTGTLKAGFFGLSGIIIIAFLLCIPLVKQKI